MAYTCANKKKSEREREKKEGEKRCDMEAVRRTIIFEHTVGWNTRATIVPIVRQIYTREPFYQFHVHERLYLILIFHARQIQQQTVENS